MNSSSSRPSPLPNESGISTYPGLIHYFVIGGLIFVEFQFHQWLSKLAMCGLQQAA